MAGRPAGEVEMVLPQRFELWTSPLPRERPSRKTLIFVLAGVGQMRSVHVMSRGFIAYRCGRKMVEMDEKLQRAIRRIKADLADHRDETTLEWAFDRGSDDPPTVGDLKSSASLPRGLERG